MADIVDIATRRKRPAIRSGAFVLRCCDRDAFSVMPYNFWPVCVHEAGHARAHLALGLRVKRIAVTSDGSGECRFPTLYAYQDTDPLILLRHVVCALAGVAAQRAFTQGYSVTDIERGGSADHADAERLALLIAKNGAAEIMGRAQAITVQLVTVHREQIFALARQLYVRGSLTSAEMRAVAADIA